MAKNQKKVAKFLKDLTDKLELLKANGLVKNKERILGKPSEMGCS